MVFTLSFAGAQLSLVPTTSPASDDGPGFVISGVRYFPDGHIEAEVTNFSGKIIIADQNKPPPYDEGSGKRMTFSDKVAELRAYKDKHGNVDVTPAKNEKLASFCKNVRCARRNPEKYTGTLDDDKIAALDELGFDWDPSKKAPTFLDRLEELRAYKEENGHIDVRAEENARLSRFCYKVRYARKFPGKGRVALNDERIKSLDDLGFSWEPPRRKVPAKSFSKRLDELRAFREEHGHMSVTIKDDEKLAKFCQKIRRARKSSGDDSGLELSEERIASLDALGFDWEASTSNIRKTFDEHFNNLKKYHEANGHFDVDLKENPSLYNFMKNIRYARTNPPKAPMKLTDERIASLDGIGFPWGGQKSRLGLSAKPFTKRLNELRAFKEEHGHLAITKKDDEGLYHFCTRLRKEWKRDDDVKISRDQIRLLDELGFDWYGISTESFAGWYHQLKEFKEENGHLNVEMDNRCLFGFCNAVRYARNNPDRGWIKLTKEQIACLDMIGLPWESAQCEKGDFAEGIQDILKE